MSLARDGEDSRAALPKRPARADVVGFTLGAEAVVIG